MAKIITLLESEIKVFDARLNLASNIPILNFENIDKFAVSKEYIFLLGTDFTPIGDEEHFEIFGPEIRVILLRIDGSFITSLNIKNAFGLAVSLTADSPQLIYSEFGDNINGRAEIAVHLLRFDNLLRTIADHSIRYDSGKIEFPICEATFDIMGNGILMNIDGDIFTFNAGNGEIQTVSVKEYDRVKIVQHFTLIRNFYFDSANLWLGINYGDGRLLILSYNIKRPALELEYEFHTCHENSFQFHMKEKEEFSICSSRGCITKVFKRANAVRFIFSEDD